MARSTNKRIVKEHLILCEGRDAEEFLISYLNSNALSEKPFFSNDIQVMDFGGNENLLNYLLLLKNMDGFSSVQSILIIRDAERDAHAAVQQISSALESVDLSIPSEPGLWTDVSPRIGFLLFPTCDASLKNGTLEDLCLSILSEPDNAPVCRDICGFIEHLKTAYNRKFPHEFKSMLHSYFSVTDSYVALKIGEAAKAGAFNWTSPHLNFLRDTIEKASC